MVVHKNILWLVSHGSASLRKPSDLSYGNESVTAHQVHSIGGPLTCIYQNLWVDGLSVISCLHYLPELHFVLFGCRHQVTTKIKSFGISYDCRHMKEIGHMKLFFWCKLVRLWASQSSIETSNAYRVGCWFYIVSKLPSLTSGYYSTLDIN